MLCYYANSACFIYEFNLLYEMHIKISTIGIGYFLVKFHDEKKPDVYIVIVGMLTLLALFCDHGCTGPHQPCLLI